MASLLVWGRRLFVRRQGGARAPKPRRSCMPAVLVLEDRLTPDVTLSFSTSDPGVSRPLQTWGLDTTLGVYDLVRRGALLMGPENVNIIRMPDLLRSPLDENNNLPPEDVAFLQNRAGWAALVPNALWEMHGAGGINSWYKVSDNVVYPDRFAAGLEADQRAYNHPIWAVSPFNEPDWAPWGQGTRQNLYDIFGYLQGSTEFAGANMAGGSTLDAGQAISWYSAIQSRASIATTHAINGSMSSYIDFIQYALEHGAMPYNDEVHNVGEAIVGAHYGLQAATWWDGRGKSSREPFVKASHGTELAYAEDRGTWTSAAVYRAPSGEVQAFFGGSERQGGQQTYHLFSTDRPVFYNGDGPRRDFTYANPGNAEQMVNISWGEDVQPAIPAGRYIIVNRLSHKVLQVPNASQGSGVQQVTYTGATNQLWDVAPTSAGELRGMMIKSALSGRLANVSGQSYDNGAHIIQWGSGAPAENERWYLEYTSDGYFKIRSAWAGKVMGVENQSLGDGATIVQWDDNGTADHEWRLIPAGEAVQFVAPAAPTGLTATANALSVQLNWDANSESDLAGYSVLRATSPGGPYETIARGLTTNAFTDNPGNRSQTYYYVVKAVDRSLNTSARSAEVSATLSWVDQDIGSPGQPGYADFNATSGTWTVVGGGRDIGDTADQFHFTSQGFTGDGSLTARVTSVQNTDAWAKAGVMFRDSADPGAPFADVVATPGNGVAFQWRSTAGAVPNNVNVTGLSAPVWVQLVRAGDAFTASYSSDGVNWTQVGAAQTVVMTSSGLAGLAVTSHDNARLCTATFDNVDLAAPASHFVVITDAANPDIAGTPFDATVIAEDSNGNVDPTYRGTIHWTSADPYGASLPADYTFQASDRGIVTFHGSAALYTAGAWDVTATDLGSGITGSASVNVQAAPAVGFYVVAPSGAAAGVPFDLVVIALDAFGNIDTNYRGTVTFATSDPGPGAELPADYTFRPEDGGIASFAGEATLTAPGDQTITVTDPVTGIRGIVTIRVT
jgi:hypothetical protein